MSKRASVVVEQDQEAEGKRAERERRNGERERALCIGSGGASRGSPGKGRCVLPSSHGEFKLVSDWLKTDGGFPRFWSTAPSSNVTLDFVVKRERLPGRRERDTCSYFLCTQPA